MPQQNISPAIIALPAPRMKGPLSLEETLLKRRSVRSFKNEAASIDDLSQLLWAAQGITSAEGPRTAPSAGALYPIEIYAVVSLVTGIEPGIYSYSPRDHALTMHRKGDYRSALSGAALGQNSITEAAFNIVITGVFARTTTKYRERGMQYVWMEAGHAAQNIQLQCEAMELGTACVGAFHDDRVKDILFVKEDPLYIMPVGKK